MIEIETSTGQDVAYYIFEKTKSFLEPYTSWNGLGYYSIRDAKQHLVELKESFPEKEFEVLRVSVEKED